MRLLLSDLILFSVVSGKSQPCHFPPRLIAVRENPVFQTFIILSAKWGPIYPPMEEKHTE